MPSPMYNNAWLRARELAQNRPDETRDIMHSPEEQARRMALADDFGVEGDPLAEAKEFLAGKSGSGYNPVGGHGEADALLSAGVARRRAAEAQAGSEALANPMQASLTGLYQMGPEGLVRGLATAGRGAQLASIVPSAASIPLSVGGTLATIPELALDAFQGGEDAPGIGSGALALLGLAPGVQGLAKAGKGIQQAGQRAKQGADLRNTFRVGAKFQQPASSVPSGMPKAREPFVKTPVPTPAPARSGFSGDWLQDVKTSGRTVPFTQEAKARMAGSGLPDDGEDAWSLLRDIATRREGAAGDPYGSVKDFVGGPQSRNIDLTSELDGLSTLDRASQQARAQQRFGRTFRSE